MFDCCQVFNEMDLLELRFNILDPYVEKFIVVESDRTHQGELKQLNFPSNKKRFSKFFIISFALGILSSIFSLYQLQK